ncbi:hypothetical protein, partial [Pontibacillus chungwhensis]|uniref:hypothetical protein n=1 Tax=Pontibacillus chungwhensis TaxID=265426 RepID=UPI00055D5385
MNRHVRKVFATLTTAALLSTMPVVTSAEPQMKASNGAISKEQQKDANSRGSFKQDSKEKKKIAQEKAISKRLENIENRLGRITAHNEKISDRMDDFFDDAKGGQEQETDEEEEQEEPVTDEEE